MREVAPSAAGLLRHGYTLAAIEEAARIAVWRGPWSQVPDYRDCFEAARSAIAEHLYASTGPPSRGDLITAGIGGVSDLMRADRRHRGMNGDHGPDHRPSFERYWQVSARPVGSPEEPIVEQLALRQIMAALPYGYRKTLITLADHGDYDRAAAALGISRHAFASRVSDARQAFRRLWHEGERPSPMWGRQTTRVSTRQNSIATTIKKRGGRNRRQAQQPPARPVAAPVAILQ